MIIIIIIVIIIIIIRIFNSTSMIFKIIPLFLLSIKYAQHRPPPAQPGRRGVRGSRAQAYSIHSAPPASYEHADKCATSLPKQLEFHDAARPKPLTLQRRAPQNTEKHQKKPKSWVAHKRLPEHSHSIPYLKS